MARTNVPRTPIKTHGGGVASHISAREQLERSVMAHLLWEDEFYEDGESITDRIKSLVPQVAAEEVGDIAVRARNLMKLRHVPLLLVREMARYKTHQSQVRATLRNVIQRVDELTEFLAIYWKSGRTPIAGQVKKGLADAFAKFDEYQFAKYNRDNAVKLRDVLRLVHPVPQSSDQSDLYKKILTDSLTTPDTWEVALSSGANKKETWERLLCEGKLGALAIIRNLRNMVKVGVSHKTIAEALSSVNVSRVLPFRFVTAEKYAPDFSGELEAAMFRCLADSPRLPGTTLLVVDVSGSMYGSKVSDKSEVDRAQAASALATLVREVADVPVIYATAGNDVIRKHQTAKIPSRRGFGLADYIFSQCHKLGGGGIFLTQVMDYIDNEEKRTLFDRVIVITDEQDCDIAENAPSRARLLGTHNYIINVASSHRGIAYSTKWQHINGWSEAVLNYIAAYESPTFNN